ncbi:penicillin-binding protein 2 [Desulfarculus baarsii]
MGAWGEKRARRGLSRNKAIDPGEIPQVRRALFAAAALVGLAMAVLVGRLWYLQVLHGEEFRLLSENNRVRLVDVPPSRGLIFDCKRRLLADNRPTFTLVAVPEDVPDWDLLTRRLHALIGITPQEVADARKAARGAPPFKAMRLRSNLDRDQLANLETFQYELPGVKVMVEYRRAYLAAKETAHVIGYLGEINAEELKKAPRELYRMGDYVGRDGLERSRDRVLHGARGVRQVEVDAVGRELKVLSDKPERPGHDLILTLDLDLQKAAAVGMGQQVGAVVALNPKNGQVLCMYSAPSFDQNSFVLGMSGAQWQALSKDPMHPLKHRAISGVYPPGSTYKIITSAAGLSEGVINKDTLYFCSGQMSLGRRTYKCWAHKRGGHGSVNLHKALRESCDVYYYRVGKSLGVDRLAKYARAFGLGRASGVPLPHESSGLIPDSAWKRKRFGEPWQEGETLSVAIGQGFNLTTPLQLARMVAVVANGGRLVTPTLVAAVVRPDGGEPVPEPPGMISRTPVSDEHLKLIHEGLVAVVNEPHGTASRARVKGVTVAGKTGTAQVVALKFERKKGEETPWRFRDHALFVAYAPAEDPEIAVSVVIEHGGHGGSDAAPVAQRVLATYFHGPQPLPEDEAAKAVEAAGRPAGQGTTGQPAAPEAEGVDGD